MHDFLENLLGAKVVDTIIQVGLKLLLALLIGLWLVARLANLVQRALQRASVDVTLIGFLRKVVYGMLIAVLAVIVLNMPVCRPRRWWPSWARLGWRSGWPCRAR